MGLPFVFLGFFIWLVNLANGEADWVTHVLCSQTVSIKKNPSDVSKCFFTCCSKADQCKIGDSPKNIYTDPWKIDGTCFTREIEKHKKSCVFYSLDSHQFKCKVFSGFVVLKNKEINTINFPTPLNDPLVFVQATISNDINEYVTAWVANVTNTNFQIRLATTFSEKESYLLEHGVSWFAFDGQCPEAKDFQRAHMHATLLKLKNGLNREVIPSIKKNGSDRIAIFYQLYSFDFEVKDINLYHEDSVITLNIEPTSLAKENTLEANCAILMIDMNYFNEGISYKFGPLKFKLSPVRFLTGTTAFYFDEPIQPHIFYTPYYFHDGKNDNIKLHFICKWIHGNDNEWFQCNWKDNNGLPMDSRGTFGAFLMITGESGHLEIQKIVGKTNAGDCDDVRTVLAFSNPHGGMTYLDAQNMRLLNQSDSTDPKLIEKIYELDKKCIQKCLQHNEVCHSDPICLQNYLWPSCNILWNKKLIKQPNNDNTQEGQLVKDYTTLFDRIRVAICPKDTYLIEINKILHGPWVQKAVDICRLSKSMNEKNPNRKPILVVISNYISLNFCEILLADERFERSTWEPMSFMDEKLIPKNSMAELSIESLMDKYNLCAICVGGSRMTTFGTLVRDFENVYRDSASVSLNDCIETEWEPWGPCQAECIPEDGTVVRQRVRRVLYPASGDGRPCETVQTENCVSGLPSCSNFCSVGDWSPWSSCKDSKRTRQRFIRYYTSGCDGVELNQTSDCTSMDEPPSAEPAVAMLELQDHKELPKLQAQQLPQQEEDQELDVDCSLWSQWSGCTSGCQEVKGTQYRIAAKTNGRLCNYKETRECNGMFKCGLDKKIDCSTIAPAYYSDSNLQYCKEECKRLLEKCQDAFSSENEFECFARQRSESASFFFKCHFPHEMENSLNTLKKVFKNECFITRAGYSQSKGSWIDEDNGSCICSIPGAVPCSVMEVQANRFWVFDQMRSSNFCPIKMVNEMFFNPPRRSGSADALAYVSLANNARLHCPNSYGKDEGNFTFSELGKNDLSYFCRFGPFFSLYKTPDAYTHEYRYDCSHVKSTSPQATIDQCRGLCENVDTYCSYKGKDFVKCIRDRLTTEGYPEYKPFKKYNCKLPSDMNYNFNDDCQAVHMYTFGANNKSACLAICRNALLNCEARELNSKFETRDKCMMSAFNPTDSNKSSQVPVVRNSVAAFKQLCEFDTRLQTGRGYVLCKFPEKPCQYTEWSNWSKCSRDCNTYGNVATRFRTRKYLNDDKLICQQTGVGSLEFGLCSFLEPCGKGEWINNDLENWNEETYDHFIDYRMFSKDNKSDLAEWVVDAYNQYPELKNDKRCATNCKIFKTVKISSRTTIACGCPKQYNACSLSMALSSPDWMNQLASFCSENPTASVTFEGEIGNYKYYCSFDMLMLQSESNGEFACDHVDNNEYIACLSQHENVFRTTKRHFLLMGSISGLIFVLFVLIKTIIIKRNLRHQNNPEYMKKIQ
ncbi:bifunctional Thrombospondin type-1 (TSP1) repeat/Thrombospondin type-1 (TSP1) repeat superfamily [Babesia duncani]|uniref:Bifunctional Thrombospondin type-1 (TSP1) repeat/Thrombospondin type-1 (TSP1) repeat superfamily n=1 Tax=Babesia duncani TaxID=323732 RepID=A0AAD9PHV5_9APIC|nr:bifunctional Thrombospondin type-1 (TSP1) repeat/Thrombospondin type-1 (TSP1) repeat superfamily [Babesia duncani]KAK2195491.1 bifunctional Thrombospondin type-1 (TSP1) repeat/Thrombospondin type-1 (TSP1) repeat superfamily [Babesia duncani]